MKQYNESPPNVQAIDRAIYELEQSVYDWNELKESTFLENYECGYLNGLKYVLERLYVHRDETGQTTDQQPMENHPDD